MNKPAVIGGSATAVALMGLLIFGGTSNDKTITPEARATAATTFASALQGEIDSDDIVPPGALYATGATLPLGGYPSGVISILTPGCDVLSWSTRGQWFEVIGQNNGDSAQRCAVVVGYAVDPSLSVQPDKEPPISAQLRVLAAKADGMEAAEIEAVAEQVEAVEAKAAQDQAADVVPADIGPAISR